MKLARGGLFRTTLRNVADGYELPIMGVYIVNNGSVLYVGGAPKALPIRFRGHFYDARRGNSKLGLWMHDHQDEWDRVRIDVLTPPNDVDSKTWIREVEIACIRKFRPAFNVHHNRTDSDCRRREVIAEAEDDTG